MGGGGIIRAVKLELDKFPGLDLRGTARGLPAGGVKVPIAAGDTEDFIVTLAPSDVEMGSTSPTRPGFA